MTSQIRESQLVNAFVIDRNRPGCRFDKTEEGEGERGLAGTGAANNTDFFTRGNRKRNVLRKELINGQEKKQGEERKQREQEKLQKIS